MQSIQIKVEWNRKLSSNINQQTMLNKQGPKREEHLQYGDLLGQPDHGASTSQGPGKWIING